jgi:hypothetical protein
MEMLTQYAWDQMYLATPLGMENVPDVLWKIVVWKMFQM